MISESTNLIAQYIVLVILYICAYWYSLKFAVALNDCHTPQCERLRAAHEGCMCHANVDLSPIRGGHYYIGTMNAEKQARLNGCVTTFWSASHFALYTALGFFAPSLFWPTFAIGVGFEFYEKYAFDCHDVLDVAYNSCGFLVGRALNRFVNRT